MKRSLTCILCPRGCSLTVEGQNVTGNTCSKGADYAIAECVHPMRTVTSTVTVSNREDVMVSVKTAAPIPKEHIFEVMSLIRSLSLPAPIHIGDVIARDVCGTEIIATKTIL